MAEPQNKSNTGIIIGVVVVIIIALGWYFYGGSTDTVVEPEVVETPATDAPVTIEPDSSIATDPAPAVDAPVETVPPATDETAPAAN